MRAVVFDLDGTLIDSVPDLTHAVNELLAEERMRPVGQDVVRDKMSCGGRTLLRHIWQVQRQLDLSEDALDTLYDRLFSAIVAVGVRDAVPFPGTAELLAELRGRGLRLGVCTNNRQEPALALLSAFGLSFEVVVGGDALPYKKPDPRHVQAVLEQLAVQEAVMVGDTDNDVRAAAALGLRSIAVEWGYGRDLEADAAIDDWSQLWPQLSEWGWA